LCQHNDNFDKLQVDLAASDALAVPGSFEVNGFYNDAYDKRFLEAIRRLMVF
jgi:hypothetical protein